MLCDGLDCGSKPIKLASIFFLSNFNLCEMFVCAAQSHCFNVLALAVGVLEAQLKKYKSTPHQLFMGGLGRDICWLYMYLCCVSECTTLSLHVYVYRIFSCSSKAISSTVAA